MIRSITPAEAGQVFDLMGIVYATHSFLDQGLSAYQAQLATGRYVSLGHFNEDGRLNAHAGYRTHADFALINALVVDPATRSAGLGRTVFEARLAHIKESDLFDFVVGYSMTQHLGSQKLYKDGFKPIGLEAGYDDIYHQADAEYNRGTASNAELVLCKRLSTRDYVADLAIPTNDRESARHMLGNVGIDCRFTDGPQTGERTFLGFHPDTKTALCVPAFLDKAVPINFAQLLTSNTERQDFVNTIQERHG